MRQLIKGFVAISIIGAGFLGGFTAPTLKRFSASTPAATVHQIEVTPALLASRLARLVRPAAAYASGETPLSPMETYYYVLQTIRDGYYNPPADLKEAKTWSTKLKYAAIDGMLASIGDRYTEYWNPEEYRRNMEETSGRFSGIGAKLDITKDKKVIILEPIENSPAIRAGILPGDIIAQVDGLPTFRSPKESLDDVIKRIKGPQGTAVRLTIERKGAKKPLQLKIVRDVVNSPIVEYRMQDAANKVGYIRLDMFNEEAAHQFDRALDKLEQQGMRALLFDLRSNPGGLLNIAVDVASRFIKDGPVVWIQQRDGGKQSQNVDTRLRTRLHNGAYPVIVLVNGMSASASEIVSGAIQDAGTGYLLGTRTYGKGLVQTIMPLSEGAGAVKITTQHYFTRNQHDINLKRDESGNPQGKAGGIKPDIVVEVTEKDLDAQRNALRDNPRDRAAAAKFDPQIRRAVDVLRDRLAGKPWPASEKDTPDAVKTAKAPPVDEE